MAWSSNSSYLASASDEIIRVWEALSGQEICTYQQHFARIVAMAWAGSSMQIASLSQDNSLHIWDANTGNTVDSSLGSLIPQIGRQRLLAWSPDGRRLALAGHSRSVEILDVTERRHTRSLQGNSFVGCSGLSWAPDGQFLAAIGENAVYIWDVHTGKLQRTYVHSANVSAMAWAPDGFYIASCGSGRILQIWIARTGELRSMKSGTSLEYVNTLAWSPRSRFIVTGSIKGDLLIWTIPGDEPAETYTGHVGAVLSVAWSPDGRYLASGGADETVRIWQAPAGGSTV